MMRRLPFPVATAAVALAATGLLAACSSDAPAPTVQALHTFVQQHL